MLEDVCGRVTARLWRSVMHSPQALLERDDLLQQARLVALTQPPGMPMEHLYRRVHFGVIDYLRSLGQRFRDEWLEFEPFDDSHDSPETDPHLADVEVRVDLSRALQIGDRRGADIARLTATGLTLRAAGARHGLGESAACKARGAWLRDVRAAWSVDEDRADRPAQHLRDVDLARVSQPPVLGRR